MKKIPPLPSRWIDSFRGPVLLAGGNGMLGWEWRQALSRMGLRDQVHAPSHAQWDVSNESQTREWMERVKPVWVVNASAYTQVDQAEREEAVALQVNGEGPAVLAGACARFGARLVHYSTDQVLAGDTGKPMDESTPVHPLNAYGRTKAVGEAAALANAESLVLRVQWLYGERKDRFTPLKEKEVFTPFSDQVGAPTWTRDVVELTLALLSRDARGLFHCSYDDYASWAEVFAFVKDHWKLGVRLEPKATREFTLPATRPLFTVMSNAKAARLLGLDGLGSWRESLAEFLTLVNPKGDPTAL